MILRPAKLIIVVSTASLCSGILDSPCLCRGIPRSLLRNDPVADQSVRRIGKRSLAVATFAILILIHTIYSLSSTTSSPSTPIQDLTKPAPSLVSSPTSSQPPQIISAPPEPPSCAVIKVSMLYGAHKFPQLEAALDSHRRHSERWKCGFESLEQDISSRKLYSKHYFLMSTMLHELAKPAEERKQWLM